MLLKRIVKLGEKFYTYSEFWKYYLRKHASAANRFLHVIGLFLAFFCLIGLVFTGELTWLWIALACGFGFGWIGHLLIERNAPIIISHPIWAHFGDLHMLFHWCKGTLRGEINRSMSRDGPESLGMYEGVPPDQRWDRRKKTRRE
jgi:hypothetical protein